MVLIATRGANSTIIGAIRSMKSAAPAVAFGSGANIGCANDSGPSAVARVRANAGRSLPAPVAITVAKPSRTKSLRLIQRHYWGRSWHDFHCFELLESASDDAK